MHSQIPKLCSEKILAARQRRAKILSPGTDAFRLVDGRGDQLDGMMIDAFAGCWLIQTRPGFRLPPLPPDLGYRSLYHKLLSPEKREAPEHLAGEPLAGPFLVRENGCHFWVDFQAGYSQGIFLDQRDNRSELRRRCAGKTVLNTFAYTCGFGVAAALGGALTVNLDLSRSSLDWGKRNYAASGIDPSGHDFVYGDAFDWLRRFNRRERRFDLVVLDPPTFSRDRRSHIFRLEDHYGSLVELARGVLNPGGTLLCCANTHRLLCAQFQALLRSALPASAKLASRPMPEDFPGSDYLKTFWVEL